MKKTFPQLETDRQEVFYAAVDAVEGFRQSCGLAHDAVYAGFEELLHRSLGQSWRVVAVTREAAAALIQSGFDMRLVQRAHKMKRADRYGAMIALPRAKQYAFYFEQDEVVLTTKAENSRHGVDHWSEVLALPPSFGPVGGTFRAYFTKPQQAAFVELFGDA